MKVTVLAGMLLAAVATTSHADEYEFRHYISGLQPSSAPGDLTDPSESWSLPTATLPKAITGEAYSFSFQNLITPGGLEGFSWAGQGIPSWASLNAGTGELTGTPSGSDAGEKSFAITASREGTDGQQVYTIEVGGKTLEVVQIAAGGNHTCAVTTDGAAMCWGDNADGQLGNGTTSNSLIPTPVVGLEGSVETIALGNAHTCASIRNGSVKCWGNNPYGQLGSGTGSDSLVPVQVVGLSRPVSKMAAGYNHNCVLGDGGRAFCWGQGGHGQLGTGGKSNYTTPTPVKGLSGNLVDITAGNFHTCAVSNSGQALCWGFNNIGQIGNGSKANVLSPQTIIGSGVKSVSSKKSHTCALTISGTALCWGGGQAGQLGNGTLENRTRPVSVQGLPSNVVAISTGQSYSCARTSAGGLFCWGGSNDGQLGQGDNVGRAYPTEITSLRGKVNGLSGGNRHVCATTTENEAYCWGRNHVGQLGDGTTSSSNFPVKL